jgi:hypothetical protein
MEAGAILAEGDLDRCMHESGSVQWASRWLRGAYQRAIGSVIGAIWPREAAADGAPAHRNEKLTLTDGLTHDVSILPGVGRHLGLQPRAKTSMTIMRAPQCGQGQRRTSGASGEISGDGSAPALSGY